MPWLDPAFKELMWCGPCGRIGIEYVERRKADWALKVGSAVPWIRTCPDCYDAGCRLVGDDIVPGVFTFKGKTPGVAA